VDGRNRNFGVSFYFKDKFQPITYGSFDENNKKSIVEFNPTKKVKTIKVKKNEKDEYGNYRHIEFYDTEGKQLEKWKGKEGNLVDPMIFLANGSMPESYLGRELQIPDKHEIIGFALQVD
jgi:hypothetical protein